MSPKTTKALMNLNRSIPSLIQILKRQTRPKKRVRSRFYWRLLTRDVKRIWSWTAFQISKKSWSDRLEVFPNVLWPSFPSLSANKIHYKMKATLITLSSCPKKMLKTNWIMQSEAFHNTPNNQELRQSQRNSRHRPQQLVVILLISIIKLQGVFNQQTRIGFSSLSKRSY